VALLLVGPAWAAQRAREALPAPRTLHSLRADALDLLGEARRTLPHRLPLSLLAPGPH
jgi:hypothetical protein